MSIYITEHPKSIFVDKLFRFFTEEVDQHSNIVDMFYDTNGREEWVYVTFGTGDQKRFSVWGENNRGITKDFFRFISLMDDYPWLMSKERVNVKND